MPVGEITFHEASELSGDGESETHGLRMPLSGAGLEGLEEPFEFLRRDDFSTVTDPKLDPVSYRFDPDQDLVSPVSNCIAHQISYDLTGPTWIRMNRGLFASHFELNGLIRDLEHPLRLLGQVEVL